MIDTETLRKWEKEVVQVNRDKGWYDQPVPFQQATALLHEEAAEAGHAWRDYGLDDMTPSLGEPVVGGAGPGEAPGLRVRGRRLPKPEGVGSELADILIRALDYSARFDLDIPPLVEGRTGRWGLHDEFMVNVNTLHVLIARVTPAWEDAQGYGPDRFYTPAATLADVVRFTMQLAEHCGIDLEAEYRRKCDYNKTRPYRHGNRRA